MIQYQINTGKINATQLGWFGHLMYIMNNIQAGEENLNSKRAEINRCRTRALKAQENLENVFKSDFKPYIIRIVEENVMSSNFCLN